MSALPLSLYKHISSWGHDSIASSSYCYIHYFRDVRSHWEWDSILLEWWTTPKCVTKGRSPRTRVGLDLHPAQVFFAAAALYVMASTNDFPSISVPSGPTRSIRCGCYSPPVLTSRGNAVSVSDGAQMSPCQRRRRIAAGIDQGELLDPEALTNLDRTVSSSNSTVSGSTTRYAAMRMRIRPATNPEGVHDLLE
jgi:hypothetical protein